MKRLLSPLFQVFFLCSTLALLTGCAATTSSLAPEEPPMHSLAEFEDDQTMLRVDDPWEGFNRKMYKFNYYADKYVILPVVNSYEYVTPVVVQDGVSNFFNNIGEIKTLFNALLQGKGKKSGNALGRFVINTTLGIGGIFDVATADGMPRQPEDFGQTLAVWGVGSGPYVVLPFLGPNTVRSTAGFVVDAGARMALTSAIDPYNGNSGMEMAATALEFIDARHQIKFKYQESGYPFEYYMVRYLYKQQREFAIMK